MRESMNFAFDGFISPRSFPMEASTLVGGWRGRLICGALLGVLLAFSAGRAAADPLIAGCCDSITFEPSYLDLVWDYYGWPSGDPYDHNLGVNGSPSSSGLSRLQSYLATDDPDAVIVLSGTPDAFMGPSSPAGIFDHDETVANIAGMVTATLNDGAEPILVAPPPVFEPCTGSGGLSCAEIDGRLYDLSLALDDLAFQEDVAFVDLYALFDAHPDPGSLLFPDGIHPNHTVGDPFITDRLLPELAEVFCGNGILDPGESCDDGNNIPGDGCSATCGVRADCLDGVDNDGDGTVDFGEDFGCDSLYDPSERTTPGVIVCDDGVDNDGDNLIDFPDDPGCGHPLLTVENPACNDGADNDGDNLIDFDGGFSALGYIAAEPDPECAGKPWQGSEAEPSATPTATPTFLPTPTPTSTTSPTPLPAGTPTPGAATPTPGVATPTPGATTPTPGVATPTPGAATPTPGGATPIPGAATPTVTPTPLPTAPFTKAQQACVNEMNKNGAKVNKAQLKESETCLKDQQKSRLTTTFEVCLTDDRKNKMQKVDDKLVEGEAKKCDQLPVAPPFAFTGSTTVFKAGVDGAVALTYAIFGGPPVQDAVLATKVSDSRSLNERRPRMW